MNRKEIQSYNFKNVELFNDVTDFFVNSIVEYRETASIPEIIKSNYLISFEILDQINKSKDFKIFHFDSFIANFTALIHSVVICYQKILLNGQSISI